jgi:hypothetical protein
MPARMVVVSKCEEESVDSRNESLEGISKPTISDVVRAVPDALLNAVPVAGAATPFLALVCSTPAQRRRDDYLQDVSNRLRALEDAGLLTSEDLNSEDFITAVLRTVPAAMSTAAAEKRAALRNAALNTALGRQPAEDLFEMFLRYVEDLTPLHIKLLVLFDDPDDRCREAGIDFSGIISGAPWQVVCGLYPDLTGEDEVCSHAWSELNARGLVNTDSLKGMMTARGIMARRTSELGRRFVQFIREPRDTPREP